MSEKALFLALHLDFAAFGAVSAGEVAMDAGAAAVAAAAAGLVVAAGRSNLVDLLDATSSRCLRGFWGWCVPLMQAWTAAAGTLSDSGRTRAARLNSSAINYQTVEP